jgi:hypothetical protein
MEQNNTRSGGIDDWMTATRLVGFVEHNSELFLFLALTTWTTIIEQLTSDNAQLFTLVKEIDRDQVCTDNTVRSRGISRISWLLFKKEFCTENSRVFKALLHLLHAHWLVSLQTTDTHPLSRSTYHSFLPVIP